MLADKWLAHGISNDLVPGYLLVPAQRSKRNIIACAKIDALCELTHGPVTITLDNSAMPSSMTYSSLNRALYRDVSRDRAIGWLL